MDDKVEMIEILAETDKNDAEMVRFPSGKGLKRIAVIVNGHPIKLNEGYVMETRQLSKEEERRLSDLTGESKK